jgi:hypothetical protein
MRVASFVEGIQAIEWTAEERGLAGVSDLEGIPWAMSMDSFFEAWMETVFRAVARRTGATVSAGRLRQTVHPIAWDKPFVGSQKALVPDLWLQWDNATMIVDAKYKRHFEELARTGWRDAEQRIREEHREDLFQVLAYSALSSSSRVVACLVYPCDAELWNELKERGSLVHKARITAAHRELELWLSAVPMAMPLYQVAESLTPMVREFAMA